MKTLCLFLLSACACFGQAFTFLDPAFVCQTNVDVSGGGSSSGYYPTNIPNYPQPAYWDGDASITNGSGLVTSWPDQSTNGWTAYQGNTSFSPVAVSMQNGHRYIHFDGVDDSLYSPGFRSTGVTYTLIIVWRYWSMNTWYGGIYYSTNSGTQWRGLIDDASTVGYGTQDGAYTLFSLTTNKWNVDFVVTTTENNNSGIVYTNGIKVSTAQGNNYPPFTSASGLTFGSAPGYFPAKIDIGEILFYPTNLGTIVSSGEFFDSTIRSNVFYSITNKWGLVYP